MNVQELIEELEEFDDTERECQITVMFNHKELAIDMVTTEEDESGEVMEIVLLLKDTE